MQEKLLKIAIIALIIIMILVSVIGIILYLKTDALKSADVLFKKYISQNVEAVVDMLDFSTEEKYIKTLEQSNYLATTAGKLKYLETQNDEEETYDLKIASIVKNEQDKSYRKAMATYNNHTLTVVETLHEDEMYGFRLSDLVNQFVSIENESIPYLVSSMGYDGEIFTGKLKKADFSEVFKFSNEEIQVLNNRYTNAIFSGISKDAYSSSRNSIITLKNGQSPSTKSYTLSLTKNDLDKVYKRVINQALEDKIILQKIEQLDEKLKEAGLNITEENSLKTRYTAYLKQQAEAIEYNGENDKKIYFTVYQLKGQTVRTSVRSDDFEALVDFDYTQGNNINIEITKIKNNEKETQKYSILKNISESGLIRTFTFNNDKMSIRFDVNAVKQDNTIEVSTTSEYATEKISKIALETNTEIDMQNEQAMPIEFSGQKNIVLNDYSEDQISNIINILKNKLFDSIKDSQTKLNTKFLGKIANYIDTIEEKNQQEEKNRQEEKIEKFNQQFKLYEGEDISYNDIQRLLDTVEKNINGYQIINGNTIRISIEEEKENKDQIDEIKNALTDRYTYNVELKYDDSKLIKSVDISVYNKN